MSNPLPNTSTLSFSYPFTASNNHTWFIFSIYICAETIMTTEYYWDSGLKFSTTTFEMDLGGISQTGTQPCIGPNRWNI